MEKYLEELRLAARAVALYTEDLLAMVREDPVGMMAHKKEVKEALEGMRLLASRLYALEVQVRREKGEDNSAETLRKLYF